MMDFFMSGWYSVAMAICEGVSGFATASLCSVNALYYMNHLLIPRSATCDFYGDQFSDAKLWTTVDSWNIMWLFCLCKYFYIVPHFSYSSWTLFGHNVGIIYHSIASDTISLITTSIFTITSVPNLKGECGAQICATHIVKSRRELSPQNAHRQAILHPSLHNFDMGVLKYC